MVGFEGMSIQVVVTSIDPPYAVRHTRNQLKATQVVEKASLGKDDRAVLVYADRDRVTASP